MIFKKWQLKYDLMKIKLNEIIFHHNRTIDDVNSIVYRFISSKSPNIVIQIGKKSA